MLDIETLKALKPSTVLTAMIEGLKKSKTDPKFILNQACNGAIVSGMICSNISSLVLVEMFGQGRTISDLMTQFVETKHGKAYTPKAVYEIDIIGDLLLGGVDITEMLNNNLINYQTDEKTAPIYRLSNFREEVFAASEGAVSWLIAFIMGDLLADNFSEEKLNTSYDGRWNLKNDDWEGQLPVVELTIIEMIAAGL